MTATSHVRGRVGRILHASADPAAPLQLTTSDVARLVGVSARSVVEWADRGHLACTRLPSGHRRFSSRDVEAFLAAVRADRVQR